MNEKELIDFFKNKGVVLFDSAMGTALMAAGQPKGTGSEEMNLSAPEAVLRIHNENIKAGSDVVTSNSFGATQLAMRGEREHALSLLSEAVKIAKRAVSEEGKSGKEVLACLGIGPTGAMLGPYGDVSHETAEEIFAAQAEAGARAGADFILLETFADLEEFTRAARAAKNASGLPVAGTMTFNEGGRSYMGASPTDLAREARTCGLTAMGANCTLGPHEIAPVILDLINLADGLPVITQPNAGRPVFRDGQTVYEVTIDEFASGAEGLLGLGVSAIGGCCGTTPAMISAVRGIIDRRQEE
jgi:5-methyltetrahydrofolate--homocysteine methyltransferase